MNKSLKDFGFIKKSMGVYLCTCSWIPITDEILASLEEECRDNLLKRCRINYHLDDQSHVHEMILCLSINTEIQPHSHLCKDESFHIIRGRVAIGLLKEGEAVLSDVCILDADKGPYFIRIRAGIQHLVVPLSEMCIVHETTQGPFIQNESIVPLWANKEGGADRVRKLRNALVQQGLGS